MLQRVPANRFQPPDFGSAALPAWRPESDKPGKPDDFAPRFGAVATDPSPTALLPPESVVVLVPGMGAPATSMRPLETCFKSQGHRTHILEIPQIRIAGNLTDATQSLARQIENIRIEESRPRLQALSQQLSQTPDPNARRALLKKTFALDDSALGQKTLAAAESLLTGTDFMPRVLSMSGQPVYLQATRQWLAKLPPEMRQSAEQTLTVTLDHLDDWRWMPQASPLSSALTNYRQLFQQQLNMANPEVREKITNHVFDALVPRVVLVGHSLGGAVGLKALQDKPEGDNPILESLSLSSPVHGVGAVPQLPQPLETFYLAQLAENSPIVQGMQHKPLPLDTAAVSICNPKDGTVKAGDTQLNENAVAGTLNLKV